MNKLVTVFSALAVAAGIAQGEVKSANVVGYNTISAEQNKFYMLGAQFENIGGGATDVQKFIVDGLNGVNFDEAYAFLQTAPQLQVWSPEVGYQIYLYLNDAYDLEKDDGTVYKGWADGDGNYASGTVTAGQGAWFKDPNGATSITIPGQIVATDAKIETIANKFNMGANPFPVEVAVNSDTITWDGLVGVNFDEAYAFLQTAPQLQVWSPEVGYQIYLYLNDAYDLEKDDGTVYEGWADGDGNYVADGTFPIGYGFWFKAATDVDITFPTPIAE